MAETEQITVATTSAGLGSNGEPGQPVQLPVVELLTGRGFVTGKSGSGKSNTASVVAERLLDAGFGILIVDIDGEYYGLKEEYEILHAGGDEECDVQVTEEHAGKLASLALEQNVPIILDVSSFLDEDEADALLRETARQLFAKAKKQKQPFLVLVEEVHEWIPEKGSVTETGKLLIKIGKRGRKHGLGIVGISQRPADVKKDFITQCDWLVWHRLTWNNDTNVVKRILDAQYAKAVEDLDDGEAFMMSDWGPEIRRVQFHRKQTFDAGATPGLDDFERPDLKSVSDDLVAELSAISEQEARREDRIRELREQLDEKNSRIAELERELQDARDLKHVAEEFTDALLDHVERYNPGRTAQERRRAVSARRGGEGEEGEEGEEESAQMTRSETSPNAASESGDAGARAADASSPEPALTADAGAGLADLAGVGADGENEAAGASATTDSSTDSASGHEAQDRGTPDESGTVAEETADDDAADDHGFEFGAALEGVDRVDDEESNDVDRVTTGSDRSDAGTSPNGGSGAAASSEANEPEPRDAWSAGEESKSFLESALDGEPLLGGSSGDDGEQPSENDVAEHEHTGATDEAVATATAAADGPAGARSTGSGQSPGGGQSAAGAGQSPAGGDALADPLAASDADGFVERAADAVRPGDDTGSGAGTGGQVGSGHDGGTDDPGGNQSQSTGGVSVGEYAGGGAAGRNGDPAADAGPTGPAATPRFVRDLLDELGALPATARAMLDHYVETGAATPQEAHEAAGGGNDRTAAYAHNRQLRKRGFVDHVGRGRYDERLTALVEDRAPRSLAADEVVDHVTTLRAALDEL